jgi:hypothetical protein
MKNIEEKEKPAASTIRQSALTISYLTVFAEKCHIMIFLGIRKDGRNEVKESSSTSASEARRKFDSRRCLMPHHFQLITTKTHIIEPICEKCLVILLLIINNFGV